jgi:DNA-binding transcriptional ArsR family regulator
LIVSINAIQIFDVLSDPNACQILEKMYVAKTIGVDADIIADHINLSPSRLYGLMLSLQEKNMIEMKDQRYFITFFGKAVYNAKRLLQKAMDNYHKLKIIDLLEEQYQIPEPELNKIIDICIDDHQLKDILTAREKL